MKVYDILSESDIPKKPKTRNPVAHAAQTVAKGSGAHRDKKREQKQGYEKHKNKEMAEAATAGATSAGSIASVANPQVALGNKQARKAYGKGASANPPKAVQAKNPDGTAKNALDLPNTSLFGGSNVKR